MVRCRTQLCPLRGQIRSGAVAGISGLSASAIWTLVHEAATELVKKGALVCPKDRGQVSVTGLTGREPIRKQCKVSLAVLKL